MPDLTAAGDRRYTHLAAAVAAFLDNPHGAAKAELALVLHRELGGGVGHWYRKMERFAAVAPEPTPVTEIFSWTPPS